MCSCPELVLSPVLIPEIILNLLQSDGSLLSHLKHCCETCLVPAILPAATDRIYLFRCHCKIASSDRISAGTRVGETNSTDTDIDQNLGSKGNFSLGG